MDPWYIDLQVLGVDGEGLDRAQLLGVFLTVRLFTEFVNRDATPGQRDWLYWQADDMLDSLLDSPHLPASCGDALRAMQDWLRPQA